MCLYLSVQKYSIKVQRHFWVAIGLNGKFRRGVRERERELRSWRSHSLQRLVRRVVQGAKYILVWPASTRTEPFCLLSVPDFLNTVLGPRSYRGLVQFEFDWGLADTEKTNVDIRTSQTLPISWIYLLRIKYFILNLIIYFTGNMLSKH